MPTTASISSLFDKALARARQVALPESTYRVQFHKGFTFRDATAIVPYLADLGVTHLYASPLLKAVAGSTHGYDVIDHSQLNPEVGTAADLDALVADLNRNGMAMILDTVPNHVGIGTNDNLWWNDVLENGQASIYGNSFDIAWNSSTRDSLHGRVLLPILGAPFGEMLDRGEINLGYADGRFFVDYYQRRLPIAPATYALVLARGIASLQVDDLTLRVFEETIESLLTLPDTASTHRHERKEQLKHQLAEIIGSKDRLGEFVQKNVAAFNDSPDLLGNLLDQQPYRLAYWKTAPDEINYRRFFDVNDLAAIAMERPEVFEATHAFTMQLLADGKIVGLRIDHPDGLYDPADYFRRLQRQYLLTLARTEYHGSHWPAVEQALRDRLEHDLPQPWPLYVLGEKILAMDEPLPHDWALHGTSGYDFLNLCNGLFVDAANAEAFDRLYHDWTGDLTRFEDLTYTKKKLILDRALASELHMLTVLLDRLAQKDRHSQDFTFSTLHAALREVIACFGVYRTYITDAGASDTDRRRIDEAIERTKQRNPKMEPRVLDFIHGTLLMEFGERFGPAERTEQRHFAGKFQQLTSPTTAKGIEDTAFYLYNRLLSLNEVGGEPSHFGVAPHDLHRYLSHRQRNWPYAMGTLSTHDTKRSEDVRARLNVLSEIPDAWADCVKRWSDINARHRRHIDDCDAPDRNEEYAIYQTLLGAWPLSESKAEFDAFVQRVQAYMVKAMREAKVYTSWTDANEAHESAVTEFVAKIVDGKWSRAFLDDFGQMQRRVSRLGLLNALSQTLVKLTAPGVPDTYQGTELWDFSLVDPDNRRPVDYAHRRTLAGKLDVPPAELFAGMEDGRIKMRLHREALRLRRRFPGLLTRGEYIPLSASGPKADHVFAFARRHEGQLAIAIAGRLFASVDDPPIGPAWARTHIALPFDASAMRNVLTNATLPATSTLALPDVLSELPIALLISA